ncbi:MAG: hypothetical protein ABIS69_11140 [Sediminibacterium sp.]
MKQKIFTRWTIRRVVFSGAGLFIIIQSIIDKEWALLLPGLYFMAMGAFSFGCASGNCWNGNCDYKRNP